MSASFDEDGFVPPLASTVYKGWDGFEALNEMHIACAVVDFTPGRMKFWWFNEAFPAAHQCTREEMSKMDLNNGANESESSRAMHRRVHQVCQLERKVCRTHKTLFPKGKPVSVLLHGRPVRIVLPGEKDETVLVFLSLHPLGDDAKLDRDTQLFKHSNELLRHINVVTMTFDADGELLYASPAAEEFYYGLTSQKQKRVVDRQVRLDDVFTSCVWSNEQKCEDLKAAVKSLVLGSDPIEFECRKADMGDARAGGPASLGIWHNIRCTPSLDPSTGNRSLIVTEFDVTKMKEVQQELLAASSAQEQFFAAISHELRTPLNAIVGLSEGLINNPQVQSNARVKKTMQIIKSSGQRLAGLVNDILDAASSKRETLVVKQDDVELSLVTETVCGMLDPLVRKGVRLVNAVDDSLPLVVGDDMRIAQILTNLCSNAIKFTESGEIRIAAATTADGSMVRVDVTDTGIGIPADKLPGIWGAFKQVDVSTTQKYGGTGLGLSLVKELVEAHNGTADAHSRFGVPDSGCTFSFTLPCSTNARAQPKDDHAAASSVNGDGEANTSTTAEQEGALPPGDPIQDYGSQTITSYHQFAALDTMTETQICIGDWTPGRKKWWWVNQAMADRSKLTKEKFYLIEMNKSQSQAMEDFQEEVHRRVQVNKEVFEKDKTIHAGGEPRTIHHRFTPLQARLPGWDEERSIFICELWDLASQTKGEEHNKLAIGNELLNQVDAITMMFDAASQQLEFANGRSSRFYDSHKSADAKKLGSLDDVTSCLVWQNADHRAETLANIKALKVGDERLEMHCQVLQPGVKSFEEVWHQIQFIPALHPNSGKSVLIVMQTDITTMHKQSQELVELYQQQEAAKQHEQFFSAVSHELRTPLNGIIGLSESLIQNPSCTEQMTKTLKLVKSSGERLANLVNDILDTASSKQGHFVVKREVVVLQEVIENVCDLVQTMVPKQVKLVNRVGESRLPHLVGDSSRLNQVVSNLLSNSIKFTEQGSITLQARLLSEAEVLLEISDTGCGIEEQHWESVWAPFKQADMSTTRKYGGTGLGLSLVKELVEAHHGRVGLWSVLGSGTTVFVVLPVEQPSASQASPGEPKPPPQKVLRKEELTAGVLTRQRELPAGKSPFNSFNRPFEAPPRVDEAAKDDGDSRLPKPGKWKHHSELYDTFEILSVDDNVVNHVVIENSLAPKGHTVTTCMGGPEALELLQSRQFLPDLILLDCMMPDMSGYEVAAKLRELYPFNTLPVIMVSAKNREDDIVRGLQAGCNDFISKPFGSLELNARIDVQFKLRYLWHLELTSAMAAREGVMHLPEDIQNTVASGEVLREVALHSNVSVMVVDIYDLFAFVRTLSAEEFATMVNSLYDGFDEVAQRHNLTRLIEDSYMLVLEDADLDAHTSAQLMVSVASSLLDAAAKVKVQKATPQIRIGMARGAANSGVVGLKLTTYSYFGQAVRDAVDVVVKGPAGCVVATQDFSQALVDPPECFQRYARSLANREGGSASDRPWIWIAKLGRYQEALAAVAVQDGEPCASSDIGVDALNPQNYLRAFLSLTSADSSFPVFGRSPDAGAAPEKSCARCAELESKLSALEKSCASCAELESKLRQLAPIPVSRSERNLQPVPSAADADVSSLTRMRRASIASASSHGTNSGAKACDACEEWERKVEALQYELRSVQQSLKDAARKQAEDSFVTQMSTASTASDHRDLPDCTRILSVDDDPVNQMVVENLLEPLGYEIETCMNGIEALEYLRTCPKSKIPNLVLLDVMMPEMTGFECCKRIRQTYSRLSLPIIMVSAKSEAKSVVEGLEAGCNDYVTKPFDRVELLARIGTQLRVREAERAESEKSKAQRLLARVLPEHIVLQLRNNQSTIIEEHASCSVLACRFLGYSALAATVPCLELFTLMNQVVGCFVRLGERHGCELVEVDMDSVLLVAGHTEAAHDHAADAVRMAVDMLQAAKDMQVDKHGLQVRMGVHSGKVHAGVLTSGRPRYKFFGDTVVVAREMENGGEAQNLRLSAEIAASVGNLWELEPAPDAALAGREEGEMKTFFLKDSSCDWLAAVEAQERLAAVEAQERLAAVEAQERLAAVEAQESARQLQLAAPSNPQTPFASLRTARPGSPAPSTGGVAVAAERVAAECEACKDKERRLRELQQDNRQLLDLHTALTQQLQLQSQRLPPPAEAPPPPPATSDADAAAGKVESSGRGGAGGGPCEWCEKTQARVEDGQMAITSLSADNTRLVEVCSSLADQVRVMSNTLTEVVMSSTLAEGATREARPRPDFQGAHAYAPPEHASGGWHAQAAVGSDSAISRISAAQELFASVGKIVCGGFEPQPPPPLVHRPPVRSSHAWGPAGAPSMSPYPPPPSPPFTSPPARYAPPGGGAAAQEGRWLWQPAEPHHAHLGARGPAVEPYGSAWANGALHHRSGRQDTFMSGHFVPPPEDVMGH